MPYELRHRRVAQFTVFFCLPPLHIILVADVLSRCAAQAQMLTAQLALVEPYARRWRRTAHERAMSRAMAHLAQLASPSPPWLLPQAASVRSAHSMHSGAAAWPAQRLPYPGTVSVGGGVALPAASRHGVQAWPQATEEAAASPSPGTRSFPAWLLDGLTPLCERHDAGVGSGPVGWQGQGVPSGPAPHNVGAWAGPGRLQGQGFPPGTGTHSVGVEGGPVLGWQGQRPVPGPSSVGAGAGPVRQEGRQGPGLGQGGPQLSEGNSYSMRAAHLLQAQQGEDVCWSRTGWGGYWGLAHS